MYLNNIKNHYKSILSLFILCTALILPLLLFIVPISTWMATFDDIDGSSTTETRAKGGTFYVLLSILNSPLFITLLSRQNNSMLINIVYSILFVLCSIILFILNPMEILTQKRDFTTILGITAALFFMLKYFTRGIFKELILVFIIIALGVCGENVWSYASSTYTLYYMVFYLIGYLWNGLILNTEIFQRIKLNALSFWNFIYSNSPGMSKILVIEFILIALYLYIRTLTKGYYGGDLIVHKPCCLYKMVSYPVSDQYQYNYTLSFWTYFNAISPGFSQSANEYTDVVLYGDNLLVAYNSSLNTMRIIMKNRNKKSRYDIHDIPLQKWNHVVLSYANGTFDIFMNGELQKSMVDVPQTSSHEVMIGAENGVQGELCTMMFYNRVLTMNEIQTLYTQFKDKNPPTV
jgi:hypothetical protein